MPSSMKKLLLTLAAVFGFASQAGSKTAITLDQISAPNSQGVMVSVVGKGWVQAQLDAATLTLDTTTNPPTLKANSGGPPVTFVDGVVPVGTVDGVNTVFTLPSAPNPSASLDLTQNGLGQAMGVAPAPNDFTLNGNTITYNFAPSVGSKLLASYRR